MMKFHLLVVFSMFASQIACAQSAPQPPSIAVYPTVATGDAKVVVEKQQFDLQEITRQTEEALRATRRFTLFERSAEIMQNSVLKEQDFAQSGKALGDAAEFGKLNNVGLIVQPLVTATKIGASFAALDDFPGRYKRTDAGSLVVTFKVLDTTSGQLKYQTTQEAGFSLGGGVVDGKTGGIGRDAWASLAHGVAVKGASAIVNSIFPIEVIKADDTGIYLNRGEGGGIDVGESYNVFGQGEALVDPASGETLGSTETLLGRVKISRVNSKFSVANPIGKLSQMPKPGDILRPINDKSK